MQWGAREAVNGTNSMQAEATLPTQNPIQRLGEQIDETGVVLKDSGALLDCCRTSLVG